MTMHGNALDAAKKLVNFLNESPTPFHATQNAAIRLEESGFKKASFAYISRNWFLSISVDCRDRKLGKIPSSWWKVLFH